VDIGDWDCATRSAGNMSGERDAREYVKSEVALYFPGSAIQEVNYRNSISTMSPSFSW
jgi:hypothetical protein